MTELTLTAIYEEAEEGGYIGYVAELPGANTQGETLEEVRENLTEAIQLILNANREQFEKNFSSNSCARPSSSHAPHIMKRADLIRHLESHRCFFVREGSKHTVYRNLANGSTTTIPRHREIKKQLARKICVDLRIPLPQ
jgi:mRNA interferase HicA